MTEAKVLILDIETSPILAHVWRIWDENIGLDQIEEEWNLLSYCAKWLGAKELMYEDTGGRGPKRARDDRNICKHLWKLLDDADIVVAQNGAKFDIRKINARLIVHGFGPYSPIRVVDTLLVAKRHFGFTSNKLAWMSKYLTRTQKEQHKDFPGFELWTECLKDNPKAWAEMRKYNQKDVIACEELYLKLRPWITGHPNVAAYTSSGNSCPKCGSKSLQRRGVAVLQQGRYQRYHCRSCGGWSRGKSPLIPLNERRKLMVG